MIPEDGSITAIFGSNFSTDFEQVAKFEPATRTFTHFVNDARFDDFTTLEYGVGYQMYCKASGPVTVSLRGKTPTRRFTQDLSAGWHLLPTITTDGSMTVGQVFAGIASSQILRYDPAVPPNGSLITVPASEPARMGEAYYAQVTSASTWQPPLPIDVTTRFTYDGDGGRVKQTTAAGTTTYLGESVELAPDGTRTTYVFAGSQRVAAQETRGTTRTLRYYHTDHLGSSNVITDATGAVVELAEYTPYGSLSTRTGPTNVAHKFTGQRLDNSTGLYFYHARYYDPQLGRFISPDTIVQAPADPQTLNRYSYVRNNPLKYVDPSGHFFFLPFLGALLVKAAIGAVVGAALNATVAAFTGGDVGKAALMGAVGGAILGAGTAVAGAWSAATQLGRAVVMAGAGAIAGTASAAISGGSLGQGAAFGAAFAGLGTLVPTPNIPFFGKGPVGGLLNPIANSSLKGAAFGAGAAALQGGDIGQGAAFGAAVAAGATTIALGAKALSTLYTKLVEYEPTWVKGGAAVAKQRGARPVKGALNIGFTSRTVDPNSLLNEGGIVPRFLNLFPGGNAVSGMHDTFQHYLNRWGGPALGWALNVPGMPPAAALTYAGLLPPVDDTFLMYAVGQYTPQGD